MLCNQLQHLGRRSFPLATNPCRTSVSSSSFSPRHATAPVRAYAIMKSGTKNDNTNTNNMSFQLRTDPLTGKSEWVVIHNNDAPSSSAENLQQHVLAYTSYLDMLNDSERNRAYDLAIGKTIKGPCHVLDIGAGTGLLSMMSFRAMNEEKRQSENTKKGGLVTACEGYLPMFKLARRVLGANGMSDKIRVIHKRSEDLKVGLDLPCRADVLVSEILDSELLGEGLIPTLQHAHDHLLMPDAETIPFKATIYGQLVESEVLSKMHDLHGKEDALSDQLRFNPVGSASTMKQSQYAINCDAFSSEIRMLSEPFKVFDFDFWRRPEDARDVEIKVKTISEGRADAIVSWWVLQLDKDGTIFYSTAPKWIMSKYKNLDKSVAFFGGFQWCSHWKQCVWFPPPSGLSVSFQDEVTIQASHDAISITYYVKKNLTCSKKFQECRDVTFNSFMRPERIALMGDKGWRSAILSAVKKCLHGIPSPLCVVLDDSLPLTVIGASVFPLSTIISLLPGIGTKGFRYLSNVAEKNTFSPENVHVLGKPANQLSMDDTHGEKVDILMAEPFYLANEGTLPWQNLRFWNEKTFLAPLLSANATILPWKAILYGCAMSLPDLWRSRRSLKDIEGFNHSIVNEILGACGDMPDFCEVPILPYSIFQCGHVEALSEDFVLMEFQFTQEIQEVSGNARVPFSKSGLCHGFVFWMDWVMDSSSTIVVSSKPGLIPIYKQGVKLLKQPVEVVDSRRSTKEDIDGTNVESFAVPSSVKLHGFFDPCTAHLDVKLNFL